MLYERWTRCVALSVWCLLGAAATATAQLEQGRLAGTVTDAQGAVLPGVSVTASSPSLISTQVAITEVDGKYLFPALPSGTYVLSFELSGFQTIRRENIVLSLGRTLNVDVSLGLASIQETVTVSGESPVVDMRTTAVGSDFSGEKLTGVPSATDLWATLGQAPGVRMRGFDVGGSHKSQQSGFESFGIRNQNRVVTDGVDTTEGTGGAGIYQDFFANEEISVSAAGADVSMNTPGSAVIATVKSGGNQFRSLNHLTYEGESFVGDNVDEATSRRGFTGQPNLVFWEGHVDLGGPIKRDATWFYVAYNHFRIDKVISGVPREVATDLGDFDAFTSKVTQRLSQRDTLVGYYQWSQKLKPFRGLSNLRGPDTILAQDSASWMMNAQYQRVWSNRLFSDLKVGTFGFGWPMKPAIDWRTAPPRIDLATNAESGAGWLAGSAGGPFSFDRRKPQVALTTTYFLPAKAGSHDIKVGVEWLDDQSKFANNGASGPVLYRDRGGQPSEVRLTDVGALDAFGTSWTGADDRNRRLAVFFQDRWTPVSRLTLSLGVRYDSQRPHYEDSIRQPVLSDVFPAQTSPGRTLLRSRQTVARLGASYDLLGDGRSVVKAFYGRFYFNFADRLSAVNPGGTNRRDYVFNDVNGNRLYDGAHELGTLLASAGGTSTTLDPDLKTPYTDEIDLSFERQFWGESSLRAAYVRKMSRDEFGTYNPFREGQFTVPTDVTVSLQSFDGGIEGPRTYRLFDIPAGIPVRNIVATFPVSVGGGSFNFDTVQLAFTKRFPNGLFVQSSYEYQWRDELRDPNNISTSPLVADPIATGYHQNTHAQGAQGVSNRQRSTNWNYRLLGRYVLPKDVGVATNLRVQSGWPYGRVVTLRLPNAGSTNFFETPIAENRSELAALVDIRVDRSFRAGRYRFTLMGDVFNLLNSNAVTNFNLTNGSRFNQIIATLDPRTAMAGIRFEF